MHRNDLMQQIADAYYNNKLINQKAAQMPVSNTYNTTPPPPLKPGDRFTHPNMSPGEYAVVVQVGPYDTVLEIYAPNDGRPRHTAAISNKVLARDWIPHGDDDRPQKTKPAEPTVSFDSVVLEDHKKEQILAAIRQIDHHDLIFKEWGFGQVFEKGTAISLLFYGPPGTGKTLMGQAIADRFGYKLKVVTTAEIESSEPGQAERNLAAFFTKSPKKTVLLFDECDGLIAPRNEVGMILGAQINALLMNLEKYKGIAIFTTNRLGRLDEAFERRLSLKLEFAMPDQVHRARIWERMFPEQAPLAPDVDFHELAEIEIAGGHIKNTVLRAARMAANMEVKKENKQITREILFTALDQEVTSMRQYHEAATRTPGQPALRGPSLGVSRTSTITKSAQRSRETTSEH